LVIEFSHELMMRKMGAELLAPQAYPATIGQRLAKQLKCQNRALQNAREEGKSASATACAMRRRCGKAARLVDSAGAESSGSGAKRRLIPQQLRAPIPAPTKRRAFRGNIPKESQALRNLGHGPRVSRLTLGFPRSKCKSAYYLHKK
jgi:hypothetical protein